MADLSKVEIVGGGPAGLYAAILLKRRWPKAVIRVSEQNGSDDTFGFGVVFSDTALDFLKADDSEIHDLITPRMERWRDMTLNVGGERVTLDGIGFAAIGRLELLKILQARAADLDIDLLFNEFIEDARRLDADLVIGADGLNSLVRRSDPAGFGTSVSYASNRFAWFGARRSFDTLTQTFVRTGKGSFNAHHYRYSPEMSTFIVECDPATFETYGFEAMSEAETAAVCEEVFSDTLPGASLVANRSIWRQFPRLWCETWVSGNRALVGDAAHTAHFSVGSGTRLAMEDAIALVRTLEREPDVEAALA